MSLSITNARASAGLPTGRMLRTGYKRAAAGQAGDFLGIGKFVSGVLGGTVGSVLKSIPGVGAVTNLVEKGANLLAGGNRPSGPGGPVPIQAPTGFTMTPGRMANALPAGLLGAGAVGGPFMLASGNSLAPPSPGTATQLLRNAGITHAGGNYPGYHLNKTGYWVNGSDLIPGAHYVAPGTKWVKNRKRNPFNPKAASRSMSRLSSLHKGMKSLEKNLSKLAPRPRARPRARKDSD